jgi:hypothetical protein
VESRVWLWPNLLSLDAPLVAVLWQVLFVRCFHASGDAMPAVLLVSAVWLIYAADRALDAWRGCGGRLRHEFYRRHWRALLPVWTGVLAASAWLAWTSLPAPLFWRGVGLLGAVMVYFAAVHMAAAWRGGPDLRASSLGLRGFWLRGFRPKEMAVAVLFALGASLVAWAHLRTAADILTVLLFSCLCWINCVAIEQWENEQWENKQWESGQAKNKQWLQAAPRWPVSAAAVCVGLAALSLLIEQRPILAGAEAASAFAFVLLDRRRARLSADALRVLADVALLSPIFFLPLAGLRI